jgi:lipopolysaccharide/colanic/teichoic acid biosynthesis glycosyltransferase
MDRALDVTIACALILFSFPLMAVVALAILYLTRIDDLPQLFGILRGDRSLRAVVLGA